MGSHVLLLFIFGPSQPIIGHRRGGGGQRPTVEQASRKAKTSFFWPKRSSGGGGADQQKLLGMPSSNSFVEELSWRLTTNWAYAIGHQKRWKLMTGPNWLHSAEWNERSSPFHWAVGPEESENSKKKGEQVPFFISFRSSGPWPFLESQQLSRSPFSGGGLSSRHVIGQPVGRRAETATKIGYKTGGGEDFPGRRSKRRALTFSADGERSSEGRKPKVN